MGLNTLIEIQNYIKKKNVVDNKELKKKFPNLPIKYKLQKLKELGLNQIMKGVYSFDKYPEPELIINKLKGDNTIGYHSALKSHGLAQSSFKTVYIITKSNREQLNLKNYFIKFVKSPLLHTTKINVVDNKIKVTNIEQTILDGLNKPEYMGGFEEFYRSISNLKPEEINLTKIHNYIEESNLKKLNNLFGFLYEKLCHEWDYKPKITKLAEFEEKLRNKIVTLEKSPSNKYVVDKNWKIKYPIELENLFSKNKIKED